MIRKSFILACLTVAFLATGLRPADANGNKGPNVHRAATAETTASLSIVAGPPFSIDLPGDAKEVFVSDPGIVSATVRGQRKLFLVGKVPGQAEIFVNDAAGRSLSTFSVVVSRNLDELRETIRTVAPGSSIKVTGVGRQVVLSGEAPNPETAQAVEAATRALLGEDERFMISQIRLREPDQVMIKVTVAEVRRTVLRQLGIKNTWAWTVGPRVLRFDTADNNNAFGGASLSIGSRDGSALGTLNALDRNNALRTLAEPTLTTLSGEAATFRAGGEIPVPGPVNCNGNICTRTVEFKPYGVRLAFTPTVISEGRINLKITTVVDELDPSNGTRFADTFIPGLRNRNMQTTVELPSGGSIMTAGLLQQQSGASVEGLPGLRSLPILGLLFQSKEYERNETELLIVAVPYIAKPDKGGSSPLPTDGYILADENQAALLGRISRRYGASNVPTTAGVGFIAR